MYVNLCDAFYRISRGVWRWMTRARRVANPSLSRRAAAWGMALSETTMTDYVVLRLQEECYPTVRTFTFPPRLEAQSGADMEMWITDTNRLWLGLRIQCKILNLRNEFEKLHYRRNGQYQCDTLIQKALEVKGCFPLYLLYIGPHSLRLPPKACRSSSKTKTLSLHPLCLLRSWSLGNWWVSAYRVKMVWPKRGLFDLWPYMRPWHCFVCCHPHAPAMDIRSVWAFLIETIFQESDDVRQIQPTKDPPHYVKLTIEGRVPETVEELYRLLEGREMRHLAVMQLER